ncbi:MAG TPA: hypothetical protein VEC36_08075 [Patescibacteria group bacterium]|nr:hypothetical protein [Patescibacteria group bacterium]
MQNTMDTHHEDSFLPPARKNSWKAIFLIIGSLVITAFILITFFRVSTPKPTAFKKPKVPPTQSAYALVLSPLDSLTANKIASGIFKDINKDSINMKMVVGSTTMYNQLISLAEFKSNISRALQEAKEIDLKTQSLLFSQLVGIMISDTLPARLYLIGSIGDDSKDSVPARLLGTIRDLDLRSKKLGKVEIVDYLVPLDDPKKNRVLSYFKEHDFTIRRGNF